ncbi:tripartite motif-containing protein 43B-like [Microtus pennsylvanicus]|uniref:tripartite motif-containing protein 43B-like n=1 Tax=Microtus pennsylvanicus TaxID=10058 RepID=UPI003F6D98F4
MESAFLQAFTEELNCSICLSYLTDPVTISCGHSFCRACLHLFWEEGLFPGHCPSCRERTKQKEDFRTNIVLKKLVSIAKQASLLKYLISEENKCGIHKEPKGIFCMETRIYLCQLCSDSHMHRGHRHSPIEAAAEGEMERLLKQMTSLQEKIQKIKENLEAECRVKLLFRVFLVMREDMIRTEYRKWRAVPHEQEDQHIVRMKNEGDCVLEKLGESEAMMIQKRKQLSEMFQELMAMSQEPYVILLQGSDNILRRSEAVELSIPQAMKPELSALPITGLTESFNHFKVHISFEKLHELHFKKNLFNVMRRASFGLHHQYTSVDPAGHYLASWGSRNFISGKYYWELDLKDSSDWAVGVCTNSWLMNRNKEVETEGAFLLFCVKEGSHHSLLTTNPVIHHYLEKPLDKIGVFIDCEAGYLSFLNIAKSSLIYRYPHKTFKNRAWPFFSYGQIIP